MPEICPASNSLIHLASNGEDHWYFISVKEDGTLKLRLIPRPSPIPDRDGVAWENIKQEFTVKECFSRSQLSEKFDTPAKNIALKNFGILVSLVDRLESRQVAKMIPITEMRTFYEWLRHRPEGINKLALHAALANWFAEHPSLLINSFFKSLDAFDKYFNPEEKFTSRQNPLEIRTDNELKGTNHLVNTLTKTHDRKLDLVVDHGLNLGGVAVARELGPMRSTVESGPWYFEDGRNSRESGAGGVDLLLASNEGSIPIICEIKIGDDATPFYALVQTLAYAAELATSNQYLRLKKVFPNYFSKLPEQPLVDIYILMQDYPEDKEHENILENTKKVVKGMYNLCEGNRPELKLIIRRIAFLKVIENQKKLTFTLENLKDSMYPT